jgi:hypothetical protein
VRSPHKIEPARAASLLERLRRRRLRLTAQRRVIAEALEGAHVHLTADEVFERAVARLPEISRATVYSELLGPQSTARGVRAFMFSHAVVANRSSALASCLMSRGSRPSSHKRVNSSLGPIHSA